MQLLFYMVIPEITVSVVALLLYDCEANGSRSHATSRGTTAAVYIIVVASMQACLE